MLITYMYNLKVKLVNITKKKKGSHIENKLVVTSGEREMGSGERGAGD